METTVAKQELEKELIDYYDAFETLLVRAREYGVYKTHFGISEIAASPDYCWFKTIARPDLFPEYARYIRGALLNFHTRLFYFNNYSIEYKNALDVGFGTGGTLRHLANEWPESQIHGININKVQFEIAKEYSNNCGNVKLHFGNFLDYNFARKFDLIYFIESAFHIRDKQYLTEKTAQLCNIGADVFIADIVYSEKHAVKAKTNTTDTTIFEYLSLREWVTLFALQGLDLIEFENISKGVCNVIKITTTPNNFNSKYIDPLVELLPNKKAYTDRIMDAFVGYSKLRRMLRSEILQYGIMRFRRTK